MLAGFGRRLVRRPHSSTASPQSPAAYCHAIAAACAALRRSPDNHLQLMPNAFPHQRSLHFPLDPFWATHQTAADRLLLLLPPLSLTDSSCTCAPAFLLLRSAVLLRFAFLLRRSSMLVPHRSTACPVCTTRASAMTSSSWSWTCWAQACGTCGPRQASGSASTMSPAW